MTEREGALAAIGATHAEIATGLYAGLHTVTTHVEHVYRKIDIKNWGPLALVVPSAWLGQSTG